MNKIIPDLPDPDELHAMAMAEKERLAALTPDNTFPATSLTAWLDIAAKAGVEAIPARKIGDLSVSLLCDVLDSFERADLGDRKAEFDALHNAICSAQANGEMVRADMCAGIDAKMMMANGEYPNKPEWSWDDPRIFDLINDDGRDSVPILARPWVTDLFTRDFEDGRRYPIEFRVFFGGDAKDGAVSAYYPQAPLDDDWQIEAVLARGFATTMADICRTEGRIPWAPAYGDLGVGFRSDTPFHCTLDFALHRDGRILFLEAGPAHFKNWGAHPCCFEGAKVEGVALWPVGESPC